MPTKLRFTPQPPALKRVLVPFLDAYLNLHTGEEKFLDFAKTVFGADATDKALKERKEERKGIATNGDALGEGGACTSLMRAYVQLRDVLAEPENAKELWEVAEAKFGVEKVKEEVAKIEGERSG